jgi:hypothetical protein
LPVGDASRRRATWALAAAAALAAGAVGAAGVILGGSGVHHGGPLACGDCDSVASSIVLDVGQTGTYGINVLRNRGSKPAVLDRVVYRRLTPGLEMLHPLALRLGDYKPHGLASGLTRGFPPTGTAAARPIERVAVAPHGSNIDDVELLLGFKARRKGVFSYDALDLYYHVGKKHYVTTYRAALKVCAPTASFGAGKRKCEAHALA